ncbi:hypothetical protein G6F50_016057 [Rhizopus delemar]|uniref:Uncharacterized protein n=1 Tax=Rhizopus delemar TaxID=936053 RepID=A0A9P6XV83_9FUNG|nr:hypothetical protein G6F50_016057 [Rhizopus delemar]
MRTAAAPLLRKIRNIGWLIGRYGNRPALTPVDKPSPKASAQRLLVIGAFPRGHCAGAACGRVVRRRHGGLAERPGTVAGTAGAGRRTAAARADPVGGYRRPPAFAGGWHAALHRRSEGKPVSTLHRRVLPQRGATLARHRGRGAADRHGARRGARAEGLA